MSRGVSNRKLTVKPDFSLELGNDARSVLYVNGDTTEDSLSSELQTQGWALCLTSVSNLSFNVPFMNQPVLRFQL